MGAREPAEVLMLGGTVGLTVWSGLASVAWAGPNTLMVGAHGPVLQLEVERIFELAGARNRRCYAVAGICLADLPGPHAVELAERRLAELDGLRWVERDQLTGASQQTLTGDHAGTDDCPDLWELPALDLEAAHDRGLTGAGAPVVAIQDSGFYEAHTDMGRVSGRYDYGDWDSIPEVVTGVGVPHHGTFIAGELVGLADNSLGRAGVVSEGRVNLQKIADGAGALYFSYAVSAMADLAEGDLGVRVLNYSIAGPSYTTAFYDAVAALGSADILLVTAAANCSYADCADADNDVYPMYPGSFTDPHILTVAGSLRDGGLNSYSHYGASSVDLAAPGVDICSLGIDHDEQVLTAGGTSYAAPLVAGAAALLFEAHPELSAVEAARVLRVSAADHPDLVGKVRSDGGLDLAAALSTAVPRLEPLADPVLLDGETTVGIDLTNVGDPGDGVVVLTHPQVLAITVDDSTGWTATAFGPGDRIVLPDAGAHIAVGSGTLLAGPLTTHATVTLPTRWRASEDGAGTVTVRLVASSAGADYLNAPYNSGIDDETGFLAYSSAVSYTAAEPDSGDSGDSGDTGPSGHDTDAPTDSGTPGESSDDSGDKGGCTTVTGAPGLGLLVGMGVVARRRRASPGATR